MGREKTIISVTEILSPLGPLFAGATGEGICLLEFTDRHMFEIQLNRLRKLLNAELIPGEHTHFKALRKQLEEFFQRKRKQFEIPLVLHGTEFQKKVWNSLQSISYGQTLSYEDQAISIGKPGAVRAVASANANNRIAIIIPCHRVIAKSGKLAGYAGGLWRKQFLLDLEKNH